MRTTRSDSVTLEQGAALGDTLCSPRYGTAELYRGESIEYGAHVIDDGCDVAVHVGPDVVAIDFCHHDPNDPEVEVGRWRLDIDDLDSTRRIATGFIPDVDTGSLYGLRTISHDGKESPLLVDPYARAIIRDKAPDETRPDTPYGVIVDNSEFDWGDAERPVINPTERIIYETHVHDLTALNPDIPEELRGSYLGLAHPSTTEYLKELGVTTLELLPVQQFTDEVHLKDGRHNHWGYNTLGFFAPHDRYATDPSAGTAITEFKTMVKALHKASIEVVMDVVYNHTNEQGADGPTYSLRALDEQGYYSIRDGGDYLDTTGCGNTTNLSGPVGRELVLDSLRFWAEEMKVDGFRFDLAAAMARDTNGHFSLNGSVFEDMKKDPILKDRLLIAEPWDIWGYPQGQFADRNFAEWSAAYRDTVRGAWLRGPKSLGQLAAVMTGSFDAHQETTPTTPVNFITAHDGFTARDLTEYNYKHNEANGEQNRDGNNDNRSYNHGVEGATDNPHIINARLRATRNMMLTLMMSRGTPMVLGGDEKLHTQGGNNNAYCRNDDTSLPDIHSRRWGDDLGENEKAMQAFTTEAIRLRNTSNLGDPTMRMGALPNSPINERGVDWIHANGSRMTSHDWHTNMTVGMYTSGNASDTAADSYITYVNLSDQPVEVSLPRELAMAGDYALVAETATGEINPDNYTKIATDTTIALGGLSMVVLRRLSSRLPHVAERPAGSPQSRPAFLQFAPDALTASLQSTAIA